MAFHRQDSRLHEEGKPTGLAVVLHHLALRHPGDAEILELDALTP
jgi:hypothetical protein